MKAYNQGDTIVLNFMQRFWRPLTQLCRNWESFFHHPVAAHAYLTPPDSQAYEPHFDAFDIFVLQLHGSKTWKLYPPLLAAPLPAQARTVERDETGSPSQEVILHSGDLLYFPRGWIHEVLTSDKPSLHLSISVRPYRMLDLMIAAIEAAASEHPELRQPLAAGLLAGNSEPDFKNEIDHLILNMDWRTGFHRLQEKFLREQESLPHARFSSLVEKNQITADTRLFRHAGMLCVAELQQEATLFFSGNFLRGPANLYPALKFIAGNTAFVVRDLPGNLSADAKLVLVRRLINEGLLHPE